MSVRQPTPHPTYTHSVNLGHEIARLAAHIHAATYRFLVLLREFDELSGWADQGCASCAHWLSWRCGISVHTGREKVRVAKALAELPLISEAFEQGSISYSKARAITRIATEHNEEFLLGIALNGTASHLDKLVRHENNRRAAKAREDAVIDAFEQRDMEWCQDDYGRVVFKLSLPREEAARVIKAIEACRQQRFNDRVPAGTFEETPSARPTFSQRRADALVAMTDDWLAGKRQSTSSSDAYQVMLHVPAGTSGEPLRLENDEAIPMAAAKRICCDAGVVPIIEDDQGNVLNIGRKTRVISSALRRALNQRDDHTCRFPGCTHNRYLHGHHIEHWADGGETSLDNLILLCSHHHHLVHEGGFGCRRVDERVVFSTPSGAVLPEAVALPGLSEFGETAETFENELTHLTINKDTCLPKCGGDSMDYDLALSALAEFER
jgi:hypothetical protein